MTAGNRTYEGRAVPLKGESLIQQETAATDIMTIEGAAAQAGDFLVCRDSAEAEKFVVDKDGDVTVAGTLTASGTISIGGGKDDVTATAYAVNGAIAVTDFVASLTKAGSLAGTLAAPGATNWPKLITVYSTTAQAHVITVTGLSGGNTLTFGAAIGNSFVLKAISATAWVIVGLHNVTLSTV